jgi:hypothetical protein
MCPDLMGDQLGRPSSVSIFTANASKQLDDVIAYGGGRAAIAHDIDLRGGPRAVAIDLTTGAPFERFTPDVAAVDADETVYFQPILTDEELRRGAVPLL